MPFYLRKALSFGPMRLNFSKHGVGFSGGATGARVGLGPKGTYVHGGRHGLYYRKHFSGDKKEDQAEGKGRTRNDGEQRYFVDTGVSYEVDRGSNPDRKLAVPPSFPGLEIPIITASFGGFLLVIGVIVQPFILGTIGFLGLAGGLFWLYRSKQDRDLARERVQQLEQGLEERKDPISLYQELDLRSLSGKAQDHVEFRFYRELLGHLLEDAEYPTPERFRELEGLLSIPGKTQRQEKRVGFSSLLDEVMEDYVIDAEEEEQLEILQKQLGLSDDDIREEKALIRTMTEMRQAREEKVEPMDVEVNLKEGESCYFSNEGRFLKEKIQDRYQRDRIVYKAIGYAIDMEGTLYLTDRRILIVGRGSRDYDLKDVLDLTLSLQENILELVLDGRKNPVIVTSPKLAVLSGKMERLLEQEV